MDFNFKKAPISIDNTLKEAVIPTNNCESCIHFCPNIKNGYCTSEDKQVNNSDYCLAYRDKNNLIKRDVYIPLMVINKFISKETPYLLNFTGACSVFSDTTVSDDEILQTVFESKEEIENMLNERARREGVKIKSGNKIPYRFIVLLEVINDTINPIYKNIDYFNKEEVIGEVVKLIKQREEK